MKKYKRLNLSEREELSRFLAKGYSYQQIAVILRRSPSTISREITGKHLTRNNYRAICAQHKAQHLFQKDRGVRPQDSNIILD